MANSKKKSPPTKYSDKSNGQPELLPLFESIKGILSEYVEGNYILKGDRQGLYEVYYDKEIEIIGRKYPQLWFASILIQKGYVGFYFFPIYVQPELKGKLEPVLLKCLKGKTCFHIKKNDPQLMQAIGQALQVGFEAY